MIYIGIISQKKPIYGGYNNWVLIQDFDTEQEWSFFTKTKEYLSKHFTPFLKKMKTMKKNVKIIRGDNAGENRTLKKYFMKNFKEIKFEFTSPGTPHKNVVVEWGFAKLYSRTRAMMIHAVLHENLKTGLSPECTATATKLENIMVNPHKEKCAHEKFYGKISDYKNT